MCALLLCASLCPCSFAQGSEEPLTITLAGQAMIRSDIRATAPAAVPVIRSLLKGDVIFTNFEAAVAEPGETIHEGRGFLAPPESLDALMSQLPCLDFAERVSDPFLLEIEGVI